MILSPELKIGFWNAWLLMSIFIIQMIVISIGNKYNTKNTHVPKEAKKTKADKSIGILANLFWLITMIYSVFLPLKDQSKWFCPGIFIFIVGTILLAIASFNFKTTSPDKIINKGIYRFSRHPMYLATALICLGTAFTVASGLFIILTILIFITFYFEAKVEERFCLVLYKEEYQRYMNKVPRWFGLMNKDKER
jgi:protein-S-isoprenylcysteine O-methyltransferase Ste14